MENIMNKGKKSFNGAKEMVLHPFLNLKKVSNLICTEMAFIPTKRDNGLRQI